MKRPKVIFKNDINLQVHMVKKKDRKCTSTSASERMKTHAINAKVTIKVQEQAG